MASWFCVAAWVAVAVAVPGAWAQASPSYAVLPESTTAAVGYPVTIYCSIANLGSNQVFWHVDQVSLLNPAGKQFTLGPNANAHASYPRFTIEGRYDSGSFNLRIANVTANDAGMYTCLVHDPVNAGSTSMEAKAELTVRDTVAPPDVGYPRCERYPAGNGQLPTGVYVKGDFLTLTCTAKGGVPRPQLSWKRISLNNAVNDLDDTIAVSGDVTTATAKLTLTSLDHQSYYRCVETHPAGPSSPRACVTPFSGSESRMNVRFKPEVTLTPGVVSLHLLQTKKVTLSCSAVANPPLTAGAVIVLPENKTGVYPRGTADRSLVELEMTTEDAGRDFFCRAGNVLGIGEAALEIELLGLPTWLILVIMAVAGVILFIFIAVIGCVLCVDRSYLEDDKELQYSDNGPIYPEHGEDDLNEDELVPIADFEGGQESMAMEEHKPDYNPDFETGEKRYQNIGYKTDSSDMVVESAGPSEGGESAVL